MGHAGPVELVLQLQSPRAPSGGMHADGCLSRGLRANCPRSSDRGC